MALLIVQAAHAGAYHMKIRIDGVRYTFEKNRQPEADDTPQMYQPQQHQRGIQPIIQPTEIGESLKDLNSDEIEPETRMTTIDMRARLHPIEATSVLAMDALVALNVLPIKCLAFTRQKKRLSVSIDGKGREEIVQVIGGKRENEIRAGIGGKMEQMKGLIGGK